MSRSYYTPYSSVKRQQTKKSLIKRPAYKVTNNNITFGQRLSRANTLGFHILGLCGLIMCGFLFSDLLASPKTSAVQAPSAKATYKELTPYSKTILKTEKKLYVVESGESVYSICSKLSIECESFKTRNGLESPYILKTGQKLVY
jgi:LysM repeat protein